MPSNVYSSQALETRLVREAAYGVTPGSPAYKRLNGLGIMLGAKIETDPFAAPGQLAPAIVMVNDDYSMGDIEGRVDFNGLTHAFSGLLGAPVTTSLGSGAYEHNWLWKGRLGNRPASYTVNNGVPESANVVTGFIFNSLKIGGGRSDGFDVSGDGFAKAMTAGQTMGGITNEVQTLTKGGTWSGGTYTITIVETGQTTAAIAYNANAATVQAAIDAALGFSGDIVVTGGPLSTTALTFTYGGYFAGRNVAQLTADITLVTGTSPTVTPATSTPGADAVTDVPAVPAGAVLGNVYLDTTWAGLGTTQPQAIMNMDLEIGERMSRVRPINKAKTFDTVIDVADQEHTLALTFLRNATADAQLARLRAGTKIFPRVEWVSDQLIGATAYLLQIDSCIFYTEAGMPDDDDGASTVEYTGRMAIDDTTGNVLAVKLRNAVASL